MINLNQVQELAMKIPKRALLVLDGAYAEYVDNYDGGIQLAKKTDNVIMIRTFSKIYGLGGMRVGWGFSSKSIIEALQRVRGPFNLSVPALAVAEAAIEDQDYVEKCKEENIVGIKGHRLVGGYRASMYNALPIQSVQLLVDIISHIDNA